MLGFSIVRQSTCGCSARSSTDMNDRSSASSSWLDGEGERLGLCSEGLRRPRWRLRPRATCAGCGESDRRWRSGEGVHAGSRPVPRRRWRPRPRATFAGGGEGDRLWRSGAVHTAVWQTPHRSTSAWHGSGFTSRSQTVHGRKCGRLNSVLTTELNFSTVSVLYASVMKSARRLPLARQISV